MKKLKLFILLSICTSLFVSCSNESEKNQLVINPTSINCYFNEETQINVVSGQNASYQSGDDYVATVNENGVVKAKHIGNTDIIVSSGNEKAICKINVKEKYHLFDEPKLDWTLTKSDILAQYGQVTTSESYKKSYLHMEIVVKTGMSITYIISQQGDGTLSGLYYQMDPNYYSAEEVVGFVYERYTYVTETAGEHVFIKGRDTENYDAMISVGVSQENKYRITYLPNSK